ncbi:MAG TPA: hypothetical protein VGM27_21505 [Acidobacteriaceae bacterium]
MRKSTLLGAIFFCAFSAFWTTLVFFLQTPPYHYGSGVAGLFGLVGAAGAICAPLIGRTADDYGARCNILIALLLTPLSFVVMYVWGTHLAGLIAGVVLLDVSVRVGHISSQTRIYGLLPEARCRLNMDYMICYFTGRHLRFTYSITSLKSKRHREVSVNEEPTDCGDIDQRHPLAIRTPAFSRRSSSR